MFRTRLILLANAVLLAVIGYLVYSNRPHASDLPSEQLIVSAMQDCFASGSKSPCYRNAAEKFLNAVPTSEIFQTFEKYEGNQNFYANCHETMHFLGQAIYKKNKVVGDSLSAGNAVCFAGYYHGVLEAYLEEKGVEVGVEKNDSLIRYTTDVCKSVQLVKAPRDYNECLHGLGHALMYATDGELPQALAICDPIPEPSDRSWCYTGVFMENSTSSTNKDHPSKYLKPDDPTYPCTILEEKYLPTCYTLQSFYIAELVNWDAVKMAEACQAIPEKYRDRCINAIGQISVGASEDLSFVYNKCLSHAEPLRIECMRGAVGAIGERFNDGASRAVNFCSMAESKYQSECYKVIYFLMKNWAKPAQFSAICESIPETVFRNQCLKNLNG